MTDQVRYVVPIGKYPISQIERDTLGFSIAIQLDPNAKFVIKGIPLHADLRLGDILTLYTEVLVNAQPSSPSKQ